MKSKKNIDKLMKYLKEWCSNDRNDGRKTWDKKLRESIDSSEKYSCAVGALQLWYYANWHSQHGLLSIYNGDSSGWSDIQIGLEYRWWHLRLNSIVVGVAEANLLLAHLVITKNTKRVEWLSHYQVESLKKNIPPTWNEGSFGKFILLMLDSLSQNERDIEKIIRLSRTENLGIYQDILNTWSSGDGLADAIYKMCDFHLEQALTQRGYPQFALSPYDILPVDYIITKYFQEELDIAMPAIEHPLLSLPFSDFPSRQIEINLHPDLQKLLQKARENNLLKIDDI
jgi:hypothetical protein